MTNKNKWERSSSTNSLLLYDGDYIIAIVGKYNEGWEWGMWDKVGNRTASGKCENESDGVKAVEERLNNVTTT